MKHIIKLKYNGLYIISLLVISILVSVINALELVLSKGTSIISFILIIISAFLFSYKKGKLTNRKGYICGALFGLINILFMFMINIIFYHNTLNINTAIYYLIIIFINILGSMIGKNKKGLVN